MNNETIDINVENDTSVDEFSELIRDQEEDNLKNRKEKLFFNLLKNYFNRDTPCYGYDFKDIIEKIKNNKEFASSVNDKIKELGGCDIDKFISEPEIFDFPNKNKRRYFKYINFFHYYYACLILKEKFFNDLDEYFQKNNFGVYNHDLIEFSDNIIYDPLDEFLKHDDIKVLFDKKYKHKDIEIISSYDYILECDIANFFPSIYTHLFPRILNNDCSNGETQEGKKYKKWDDIDKIGHFIDYFTRNNQNKETIGLPIGSVLYSVFAEIISIQIDSELIEYLKNEQIEYLASRVTDDRTIGFKNRNDAEKALQKLREILHSYKLSLNYEKTKIFSSFEFFKEVWINDIVIFTDKYEKYAEKYTKSDDEETKDRYYKKLIDIVNQFNNTVFYWFNNIKSLKDRQNIIKYAAKVLSNSIKKYSILDKSHINVIVRLIKVYPPIIQFLLPIIEKIDKLSKQSSRVLNEVIDVLDKSQIGQSGEILWCLQYINCINIPNNEIKNNILNEKRRESILKTVNSFCFALWNNLCTKNDRTDLQILSKICINNVSHSKTENGDASNNLFKNLIWFKIINYNEPCANCDESSVSKYKKTINELIEIITR